MKCPKCGGDKFYAVQRVEEYKMVVVDSDGGFIRDVDRRTRFRHPDEDDCVDCGCPEGPFYCVKCHTEAEYDDE